MRIFTGSLDKRIAMYLWRRDTELEESVDRVFDTLDTRSKTLRS